MADREQLDRVIDQRLLDMHFQPILDLRQGTIYAYEALCRPRDGLFHSPQELVRAAVRADRIGELGRLQRGTAIKHCPDWPLFLNIEPSEFDHGWLVRPDDPIFRHRRPVCLEITETVPLKFFEHYRTVLQELRKKGALLAVDDLGAGFSNLKYITELQPDLVKLDRELVGGARRGTREFGLLRSITRLCHQMSATVVAEGVETEEELETVIAAGVDYCQGFLLARPAAEPPDISWPEPSSRRHWMALAADARERENRPSPAPQTPPTSPSEAQAVPEPAVRATAAPLSIDDGLSAARLRNQLREARKALAVSERDRRVLAERLQIASTKVDNLRGELELARDRQRTLAATDPPSAQPPWHPQILRPMAWWSALIGATAIALLGVGLFWPRGPEARQPVTGQRPAPAAATRARTVAPPAELPGFAPGSVSAPPATQGAAASPSPPAEASRLQRIAVVARIEAWARSWSEQQVDRYLSFYSRVYEPTDGSSLERWREQRRERIERPDSISVVIDRIEIEFAGSDRARARFRQIYRSATYRDEVTKVLDLVLEDGDWRILRERSEPA